MNRPLYGKTTDGFRAAVGVDFSAGDPVVVRMRLRWGKTRPDLSDKRDSCAATVGGLCESESAIRKIHVPLASRRKAARVWPSILDIELPGGMEGKIAIPLDFRSRNKGWDILVAVADREAIAARIEQYQRTGFDLHGLDQESLALWTAALREFPPAQSDEPRAVVWAAEDRFALGVGKGLELRVATGVRKPDAETLRRFFRAAGIERLEEVRWIWGGPRVASDANWETAKTLASERAGRHERFEEPAAAMARAYAVRALEPGVYPCNFRIGKWAHPEVVRRISLDRLRISLLGVVSGLIAFGGVLFNLRMLHQNERDMRRTVVAVAEKIGKHLGVSTAFAPGYELFQTEAMVREAEPTYRPFLRLTGPSRLPILRRLLSSGRRFNVNIHRLEWQGETLRLAGTGPSPEMVERWMGPLVSDGTMQLQRKEFAANGSRYSFELEAIVR